MLVQSFLSIPREIRKLVNNVIIWKPSKVEFITLFDELFETEKDDAMALMRQKSQQAMQLEKCISRTTKNPVTNFTV